MVETRGRSQRGAEVAFLIVSSSYCVSAWLFFLQIKPNVTLCVNILIRCEHTEENNFSQCWQTLCLHHQCRNIFWLSSWSSFPLPVISWFEMSVRHMHQEQPTTARKTQCSWLEMCFKAWERFLHLSQISGPTKAWRVSSPARHAGGESVPGMLHLLFLFITCTMLASAKMLVRQPKLKSIASALLLSHSRSLKAWPPPPPLW